jgi:hypothetical protein
MTKEAFILMLKENNWPVAVDKVSNDSIVFIEELSKANFNAEENQKLVEAAKNYLRTRKLKLIEEKTA